MPDANDATVLLDIRDDIAHIILNRPGAMNALNLEMAKELLDAAMRCDETTGVLVRAATILRDWWNPKASRDECRRLRRLVNRRLSRNLAGRAGLPHAIPPHRGDVPWRK